MLKPLPRLRYTAVVSKSHPSVSRTREIESILRIENGETAILGGLMEDRIDYKTGRIPLISAIPLLGELFTNHDNAIQKTELVIFLRPVVVREPGLVAATAPLRDRLPDDSFFTDQPRPGGRNFPAPHPNAGARTP